MNNPHRITWLALAALMLAAPAWADDAAARFHRIYEQEWAWRNGQAGINNAGEAQPSNARLDDVDAASQQRRLEMWKKTLADLDAIDPKQLGAEDKINYAVYRTQIQNMDYLMHIYVADLQHFSRFLLDRLLNASGVADVNSSFVLRTVKRSAALPLSQLES